MMSVTKNTEHGLVAVRSHRFDEFQGRESWKLGPAQNRSELINQLATILGPNLRSKSHMLVTDDFEQFD
jgi:hypothetical protein